MTKLDNLVVDVWAYILMFYYAALGASMAYSKGTVCVFPPVSVLSE